MQDTEGFQQQRDTQSVEGEVNQNGVLVLDLLP